MVGTKGGVTNNEVRMMELQRLINRDDLIFSAIRAVLTVAAIAVPLLVVREIVTPFADQNPGLSLDVTLTGMYISWSITGALTIAIAALRRKITNLKRRNKFLEARILDEE